MSPHPPLPTDAPATPEALRAALSADARATVEAFVQKHGRRPRVLCIGNIANNGYNNGKLLVRAGWDIDTLCYDYYHIMGCPEWEDADFDGDIGDPFKPNWAAVRLNGFRRPAWFLQGPQLLCIDALLAKHRGQTVHARVLAYVAQHWERPHVQRTLAYYHGTRQFSQRTLDRLTLWTRQQRTRASEWLASVSLRCKNWLHVRHAPRVTVPTLPAPVVSQGPVARWRMRHGTTRPVLRQVLRCLRWLLRALNFSLRLITRLSNVGLRILCGAFNLAMQAGLWTLQRAPDLLRGLATMVAPMPYPEALAPPPVEDPYDARMDELTRDFVRAFPERADHLERLDMEGYRSVMPRWRELCSYYDMVIGYSTDGVYPLLSGKHPYLAYEHGTIRNIPFETNACGRLTSLVYRKADAVVITNCDNILAAGRLRLTQHRFVPHPINEDWLHDTRWEALRHDLRTQLKADFIVFHPARQHWEEVRHPDWEKGNDVFIRGFARFVHEVCPTAATVMVAWGKTLQESKDLLAELGVSHRVHWIEPQPTPKMLRYLRAADVVADQFYLGAFGGIMPKAMVYGRPSLIYLNMQRHEWCFPEMPPVCNTRYPEDVFAALRRLYTDPQFKQQLIDDGLRWYSQYHSSELVAKQFCDILRDVTGLATVETRVRRSA